MVLAATMNSPEIAWSALTPLLILLGGTCALLLLGTLVPRWPRVATPTLTIATALAAGVASCVQWNNLYYRKGYSAGSSSCVGTS